MRILVKRVLFFFFILGIIFTVVTGYYFWRYNLPLVSPLSLLETFVSTPHQKDRIVYGFFPYWNIKYADKLHISDLTHFAYFAIDLNQDGSINKKVNPKELEPGWNQLNSTSFSKILYQVHLLNRKTVITVTAMDPDTIESILNSSDYQETAINSILDVYRSFSFNSINVDFEYVGTPSNATRNNFTNFITKLKNRCITINTTCEIDVDVFADSAAKVRLQDLKPLSQTVDHIIVMAYDYYRKNSNQAGPVAPLRGACQEQTVTNNCLEQDINTNLSQITMLVPSPKIILGVPFYGYQWQTTSNDFLANTYDHTGSLATYQRIMSLFSDPTVSSLSANWSTSTLSPYLTFVIDDKNYQIHFENPQSLELKVDLVKSANLGGIAIWAIGYEVPYLDIWQPLSDYLNNP